jgi:hypothetical protein
MQNNKYLSFWRPFAESTSAVSLFYVRTRKCAWARNGNLLLAQYVSRAASSGEKLSFTRLRNEGWLSEIT